MSFVAVGITGAALTAGAAAYGAQSQSDAASSAASKASKLTKNTNALNKYLFEQGRGASGYSVLPYYANTAGGTAFERDQLWPYLRSAFEVGGTPEDAAARATGIQTKYAPLMASATRSASGIFNGDLENSYLKNSQPVQAARVAQANVTRQSSLDSLNKTLRDIDAMQMGNGFSGDSFGNRLLRNSATRDANFAGANALASANTANATDERTIRDNILALQLQNIGLPYQLAASESNFANLPSSLTTDQALQRLQLLNFLKMTPQSYQYPQPYLPPTQTSTGALVAQGVGNAIGTGLNIYGTQQLLAAMQPKAPVAPTYTGPTMSYPTGSGAYDLGVSGLYTQPTYFSPGSSISNFY